MKDRINIYDSRGGSRIDISVKRMVCSFFKSRSDSLTFDFVNVQSQDNGYDCGLFALAYATELVFGAEPALCKFEISMMRQHLLACLENKVITRFPASARRVGFGRKVRLSMSEKIYCNCRMPNDPTRAMIECEFCLKWFHYDCMRLDVDESYKKWLCAECSTLMDTD